MATQLATFISGSINNVVFYKLGGRYVARSKPARVTQTASTKIRSKNFGIAATAGRVLRSQLQPVLPFAKDRGMQCRFSGAIASWLQLNNIAGLQPAVDLPHIQGFSFNQASSLTERCRIPMQVTAHDEGGLQLQTGAFVPVQAITAPANTVKVQCNIVSACCKPANPDAYHRAIATIEIPYTNTLVPAQIILLPVNITGGSLVVTAVSLVYHLANGTTESRPVFMPAAVTDARYY